MIISPPQAWSMLQRHADTDVRSLRLVELRNHDNQEEVSGTFVAVHNSTVDVENNGDNNDDGHLLILDWSRQRMTLETIHHLLRLSTARRIRERIRDLAWGRLAPGAGGSKKLRYNHHSMGGYGDDFLSSPTVSFAHDLHDRASAGQHYQNNMNEALDNEDSGEAGGSMHLALRAPANKGLTMRDPYYSEDGRSKKYTNNALDEIHKEWKRIESLTESLRQGTVRGASGRPLCDVLVVSAGGAVVPHALEFVYRALSQNEEAKLASLVDSSLLSFKSTVGSSGSGPVAPSKSGESMASALQSTAGGVINMVTTPFKNKSNQDLHGFASASKPRSPSSFRRRKLKVLTSIDPSAFNEVLAELSPATTMVITLDLDTEKEKECKGITLAVRNWLLSGLMGPDTSGGGGGSKENVNNKKVQADTIVQRHMFLVTWKESLKKSNHNAFLLPRHSRCEAFNTFSAAGLLPLSLVFGWNITHSFLSGAHDIDRHFVDTNPRHNLPILLSLVDLWNDSFLHSKGRIVSPYVQSFGSYPSFLAAMENKVLNGSGKVPPTKYSSMGRKVGPSPVIDGGSSALYDCCLGNGSHALSAEFIMTFDPTTVSSTAMEDEVFANHDKRICSLFAHADTLAFGGSNSSNSRRFEISSPGSPPTMIQSVDSMLSHTSVNGGDTTTMSGNQPSTLLVCGSCDAFTCGQLIALAEHRALVKAWLWDVDPFAAVKSSIQEERQEFLSDKLRQMSHLLSNGEDLEDADESRFPDQNSVNETDDNGVGGGIHSATRTVLKHYATRMQKHRHYGMPRTPLRMG